MSNFLNNFSQNNYDQEEEKNNEATKPENVAVDDDQLPQDENPTSGGLVKLKGGAFQEEEISYDQSYHMYKFRNIAVICATLIILVSIGTGIYLYNSQTLAITLTGMTQEEAVKWLDDNKVSYDKVTEESLTVDSGVIISQQIPAGEKITRSDLQVITVSSGPNLTEVVKLKEFESKSKPEIEALIESRALVNTDIVYEYSDTVDKDKLIRIEFENEGITVDNYTRSEPVKFIVSKGAKGDDKTKKVENFVNKQTDSVAEWVGDEGIIISEVQVVSELPEGYIVSQSVEPGTMLGFGDIIEIEVSKGLGTIVPSVIGYSEDGAAQILSDAGISYEVKEIYSSSDHGVVIDQSLASGSNYFEDSPSLVITKSLGNVFIDDLTGSTLREANDMINNLNSQGANVSYYTEEVERTDDQIEEGITSGTIKSNTSANKYVNPGTEIKITLYK